MNEYLKKSSFCRSSIDKILNNRIVEIGPFTSALKYVLEKKLCHPSTINTAEYGIIEFTARAIKFRLEWPPRHHIARLSCRHLEGEHFVQAPFDPTSDDPFADLLDAIDVSVHNISPFDVD